MDATDSLEQLRYAWRAALAGAHGAIIISDLTFYARRQAHTPGDPYTSAFNDGMRTLATNILLMLEEDDHVQTKIKKTG